MAIYSGYIFSKKDELKVPGAVNRIAYSNETLDPQLSFTNEATGKTVVLFADDQSDFRRITDFAHAASYITEEKPVRFGIGDFPEKLPAFATLDLN